MQGGQATIDVALLLPPYYFASAPEAGLERWLHKVLDSARMPVYLCAFPGTPCRCMLSAYCLQKSAWLGSHLSMHRGWHA